MRNFFAVSFVLLAVSFLVEAFVRSSAPEQVTTLAPAASPTELSKFEDEEATQTPTLASAQVPKPSMNGLAAAVVQNPTPTSPPPSFAQLAGAKAKEIEKKPAVSHQRSLPARLPR